jgi:hypothetical protein
MPKSSTTELRELRDEAMTRDRGCRWPGCEHTVDYANPLEMAHLSHRGMGGSAEADTLENVVMLCKIHHDCLDGRTGLGILRQELNAMLRAVRGEGDG